MNRVPHRLLNGLLALTLVLITVSPARATQLVTNPFFDTDLVGWQILGSVSHASPGEEAALRDTTGDATLFQSVATGTGQFRLQFDIFNGLQDGLIPDFMAATLFSSTASLTGIPGTGSARPLFDVDHAGAYHQDPGNPFAVPFPIGPAIGTLGVSAKGSFPQWQHYSLDFQSSQDFTTIAFELFDLDTGSSEVRLDNVTITALVPEPPLGILLLTALGLSLYRSRGRTTAMDRMHA